MGLGPLRTRAGALADHLSRLKWGPDPLGLRGGDVRYGHIETPAKPHVDASPWIWTPSWTGFAKDRTQVDLCELAQEPYRVGSWLKRRVAEEKEASGKRGKIAYTKLDLTSTIIAKHLWSKDSLMSYAQQQGSRAMMSYVHSKQRKLALEIEDAKEWASAKGERRL